MSLADLPQQHECKDEVEEEEPPCLQAAHSRSHSEESKENQEDHRVSSVESNLLEGHYGKKSLGVKHNSTGGGH